jgi:hypothetical protein
MSHGRWGNSYRTYFVQESNGTVLVSQVTNFFDGTDTSTHGIDTFKRNDLGRFFRPFPQFVLEVGEVIVLPNDLFGARMTNALDHGRVVG